MGLVSISRPSSHSGNSQSPSTLSIRPNFETFAPKFRPFAIVKKNLTLGEVERNHMFMALNETRWRVSRPRGSGARLGLKRQTLDFRMKKLGIVRPGSEP